MRSTTAYIDTGAITRNLIEVRRRADGANILAVVKADGYGHGLERVAKALAGADGFGVASIDDAERLRAIGHNQRIVLLSGFHDAAELPVIRDLDLDCVLHDQHQIDALQAQPPHAKPIRCWLKFDTGMHRLGFPIAELAAVVSACTALPAIASDLTLMTHLSASDEFNSDATPQQIESFDHAIAGAEREKANTFEQSIANSAAIVHWPAANRSGNTANHRNWVRPGGVLYGLSTVPGKTGADLGFTPAMRFAANVIATKTLQPGDRVGYGGSFVANKAMRIGIVAAGYGDGYPRHAPSGTPVLIDGQGSSTVGRVSMDLLAIDLTAIPNATIGSKVLLWGPELPAETIADCAGTISYELTCGLTRRVRFSEV
jgi:alanine racemase